MVLHRLLAYICGWNQWCGRLRHEEEFYFWNGAFAIGSILSGKAARLQWPGHVWCPPSLLPKILWVYYLFSSYAHAQVWKVGAQRMYVESLLHQSALTTKFLILPSLVVKTNIKILWSSVSSRCLKTLISSNIHHRS